MLINEWDIASHCIHWPDGRFEQRQFSWPKALEAAGIPFTRVKIRYLS